MNEIKLLRRSRSDRKIAGVLGGVAHYLNVDPTAVRVAFVILAVVTAGCALLAYPVMWIVMPEEPAPAQGWPAQTAPAPPVS